MEILELNIARTRKVLHSVAILNEQLENHGTSSRQFDGLLVQQVGFETLLIISFIIYQKGQTYQAKTGTIVY